MPPAAPSARSGDANTSSPASTAKSSGRSAISITVSWSMPPTACLTPAIPGMVASSRSVLRLSDVPVRYGMLYTSTGTGLSAATRVKCAMTPSCDGPGVIGHHGQRGRHLRPGRQVPQGPGRARGVVRARPRDQGGAPLAADPRADVQDRAPLGRGERGRLAGGAEGHEAGGAVIDDGVRQLLQRVGGQVPLRRERGDERDVQALQRSFHASEPAPWRCADPVQVSSLICKLA